MPPAVSTFEVFGFSEPAVKNGEVLLPIRTVGGTSVIHGSKALLVDLAREILRAARGEPMIAPLAAPRRRKGSQIPLELLARYNAAIADWQQGDESMKQVCARHGLSAGTIQNHLQRMRGRVASQPGAREPIVKPNGRIL